MVDPPRREVAGRVTWGENWLRYCSSWGLGTGAAGGSEEGELWLVLQRIWAD